MWASQRLIGRAAAPPHPMLRLLSLDQSSKVAPSRVRSFFDRYGIPGTLFLLTTAVGVASANSLTTSTQPPPSPEGKESTTSRPADEIHREALKRADELVASKKAAAQNCRFYPAVHLAPEAAWMSDPNAPVFYKGQWHMFYQHSPDYDNDGLKKDKYMHWGHATSTNLIRWQHQPIALAPSEEYDKHGCFSGNAVIVDGKLALLLTGNTFIDRKKDIVKEVQYLATSTDGVHFLKHPGNPVIPEPPDRYSGHFRDPFIFELNNHNYMLLASRVEQSPKVDKNGSLQLYKQGENITEWTRIDTVIDNKALKLDAYMLECPSLAQIGDKMVLSCSPQGDQNHFSTGYIIGTLDEELGRFIPDHAQSFTEFDHGHDHYATLLFRDTVKNRTLLIPWMGSSGTKKTHGDQWEGMMGLIREVSIKDGVVLTKPITEYEDLRTNGGVNVSTLHLAGNQEIDIDAAAGEVIEVLADMTFDPSKAGTFGLRFRCSPKEEKTKEQTTIELDPQKSLVTLDRSKSGLPIVIEDPRVPNFFYRIINVLITMLWSCTGRLYGASTRPAPQGASAFKNQNQASNVRSGTLDLSEGTVKLHVIVDRSSIEVFLADGKLAFSSRIFPGTRSLGVRAFSTGDQAVTIASLKKYDLTDVKNPGGTCRTGTSGIA